MELDFKKQNEVLYSIGTFIQVLLSYVLIFDAFFVIFAYIFHVKYCSMLFFLFSKLGTTESMATTSLDANGDPPKIKQCKVKPAIFSFMT